MSTTDVREETKPRATAVDTDRHIDRQTDNLAHLEWKILFLDTLLCLLLDRLSL